MHFETYQDFKIGGQYQLFFRLYKGNVHDLITAEGPHSCDGPARDHDIQPSFWTRFIVQMCSAVAYLHSKKIVHRDIKPQNVMYDHVDGTDEVSFFLGDFGLSNTAAAMKINAPGGGTPFYNAPELASTNTPTNASDIWALGVMFGEARGYWCFKEVGRSAHFWNSKLAAYGCTNLGYEDPLMALPQSNTAWPHRVLSFSQGTLIPAALALMMSNSPTRRPSAAQLTGTPIADFTESPRKSAVELHPKLLTGSNLPATSAMQVSRRLAMKAVAGLMHAPIQQHAPQYNHPHNAPVHQANAPMHIPPGPQPAVEEFKSPTSSEMNNMHQRLHQRHETATDSELYNMFLFPAYHQSDGPQAAQGQPNHTPQNRPPPATTTTNARLPTAAPPAGQPAPNGGMHRQSPQHAQHAANPRAAAPAAPRPRTAAAPPPPPPAAAPPRPNPTTNNDNNNNRYTHQRPPPPGHAPVPTPRAATAASPLTPTARPAPAPTSRPGLGLGPGPNYRPTVENTPRSLQRQQQQQQQPQPQQRVSRPTRAPAPAASRGLFGSEGGRRGQEGLERRGG